MTPELEFQRACLEPLERFFDQGKIVARLIEPSDSVPYFTLVARFDTLGESHYQVPFEFTLPPGMADISSGTYLLTMNGTLDKDVWADSVGGLTWMANRINTRLGIGAFVVLEEERQLLFRHSVLFNGSQTSAQQVKLIDQQLGIILRQLNLFIDALMEVAAGREEPAAALEAHPMAAIFQRK